VDQSENCRAARPNVRFRRWGASGATTSFAQALLDRRSRETARRALAGVCALISEGADATDIRNARSVLDAMSPAMG